VGDEDVFQTACHGDLGGHETDEIGVYMRGTWNGWTGRIED
jgi:hypothetical protein